jgi:hypothetical protein
VTFSGEHSLHFFQPLLGPWCRAMFQFLHDFSEDRSIAKVLLDNGFKFVDRVIYVLAWNVPSWLRRPARLRSTLSRRRPA